MRINVGVGQLQPEADLRHAGHPEEAHRNHVVTFCQPCLEPVFENALYRLDRMSAGVEDDLVVNGHQPAAT